MAFSMSLILALFLSRKKTNFLFAFASYEGMEFHLLLKYLLRHPVRVQSIGEFSKILDKAIQSPLKDRIICALAR